MSGVKNIREFVNHFSKMEVFSVNDIREFFHENEEDLKDATIRWRISYLKSRGVISIVARGRYTLQNKPLWKPSIDNSLKSVYSKIKKQYNNLDFIIWSTSWLNEFTNLQAFRHIVVIAVEQDFTSSVFEFLKETNLKNLYFLPDKKEVNYYFADSKETYVIKQLISKSPKQLIDKTNVPKLEKILVDLFCDKDLFNTFQGSELNNIFIKSFSKYAINTSMLLNYARRRAREKEMKEYMISKLFINLPQ